MQVWTRDHLLLDVCIIDHVSLVVAIAVIHIVLVSVVIFPVWSSCVVRPPLRHLEFCLNVVLEVAKPVLVKLALSILSMRIVVRYIMMINGVRLDERMVSDVVSHKVLARHVMACVMVRLLVFRVHLMQVLKTVLMRCFVVGRGHVKVLFHHMWDITMRHSVLGVSLLEVLPLLGVVMMTMVRYMFVLLVMGTTSEHKAITSVMVMLAWPLELLMMESL